MRPEASRGPSTSPLERIREILGKDETEFLGKEALAKASFGANAVCALLAQLGRLIWRWGARRLGFDERS